MELLRSFREGPTPPPGSAVSIGNFDGVHRGHAEILARLVGRARRDKLRATVMTFDPHPLSVLHPGSAPGLIMPVWRRCARLEELDVDAVLVEQFDQSFSALSAEAFVSKVLRGGLGARCVVIGEGFRFGANRAGTVDALARGDFGPMDVEVILPVLSAGLAVSSSRIREALRQGNIDAANDLLGRPYELVGTVVRGDGRGRALGFPTANLKAENGALPADGVYVARTSDGGGAVVNIGVRPTFEAGRSVEAHLIDSGRDLYGQTLVLQVLARLRGEERFKSVEDLKAQIARDIEGARKIMEGGGNEQK